MPKGTEQTEEANTMTYYTNHAATTKSLTEWYFGKNFTKSATAKATREHKKTGATEFRFWQDGTGYLTIRFE